MSTARARTPLLLALVAFVLLPAPALAVRIRTVDVVANDVIYNPHDGLLYLSVPGTASLNPNTITRVDPVTGAVGLSVPIGSEPRKLALSGDGSVLWVGLDGAGAIRKVDLASFTAGPQYSLGNAMYTGPLYAEDIEVLPGSPGSVAVSLRNQGYSPRHEGVAIFDEGVRRPTSTPGHTGSNIIVFSNSASRLYGQNIETTEFGFRRMNVTASGVSVLDVTQSLLGGFGGDIFFDGGRVYSTGGEVIDPEARVLLGRFSSPDFGYGAAMVPDGLHAYFASTSFFGSGEVRIQSFDTRYFTPLLNYPLPGVRGTPTALRRWASDGLALRTDGGALVLLDDINSPPTCDVALTMRDDRDPVAVDDYIYYRIMVRNLGDATADQLTIRDATPQHTSFQYASDPRGYCYDSLGTIVCTGTSLAPRDSFEIVLTMQAVSAGTAVNTAFATSATPDPDPTNNTASESTEIRVRGFDSADLYVAYDSAPPELIIEGDAFDETVLVGNRGPAEATGVMLFGSAYGVPATVTPLSGSSSCLPGFFTAVMCSIGTMPAGSSRYLSFRVHPGSSGYLISEFSVSGHEGDVNYGDNYMAAYTRVMPSAARLIDSLALAVTRLDLNHGEHNVLARQLSDAHAAIASRDTATACKELADFQEWMSRWTGRALDLDASYSLSIGCRMIQKLIGCFPPSTDSSGIKASNASRDVRGGSGPIGQPESTPPATGPSIKSGVTAEPGAPALPNTVELRPGDGRESNAPTIGMPAAGAARLELLDVQGRVVRTVYEGQLSAGTHTVPWNTNTLASGIYFYRLTALGRQSTARIAIVR